MMKHPLQKRIVIHQPNFAPWLGFFHKIVQGDIFVILDNVQYSKRSFQNRNKILTPDGPRWLTVPVSHCSRCAIHETHINFERDWIADHLKTLQMSYARTPYYEQIMPEIESVLRKRHDTLSSLNCELILFFLKILEIKTAIVYASDLEIDPDARSTERLVKICKALHGTVYVSGHGAKKYQEESLFKKNEITLEYASPPSVVYPQMFSETFVSHLSILDALFNCGGEKTASFLSPMQSIRTSRTTILTDAQ